ncbi:MAG: phage shock protein, partial [Nocardioidaceae bacterium]|nr:phage shock protein [Nocardioidaceae bacterium]
MWGTGQGATRCDETLAGRTVELSGKRPELDQKVVNHMNDIRQSVARHGLVRPREQRVLGGVCAGLGRRFGLGPWTAR